MTKHSHTPYGPYDRASRTSPLTSLALAAVGFIAVLALGLFVWYLAAPDALARLHGRWRNLPLEVTGLALTVDRRPVLLPPGQTLEIHPGQDFQVGKLQTNRWRNYDLRLYSPDFDVAAVTDQSRTLFDLLGEQTFEEPRRLRLEVKEGPASVAVFTLQAGLTALDLTVRGDLEDAPDRKAELYRRALALDPKAEVIRDKLVEALFAANRKTEVAVLWEEDLAGKPDDPDKLARLLELYGELGQADRQAETLRRLADLPGADAETRAGRLAQLAGLYTKERRFTEAAAVYEDLLRAGPEPDRNRAYLEELAAVHRAAGQPAKEIETRRRLLAVSPPERAAVVWGEIIPLYEALGDEAGQREAWQALADALPPGRDQANAYKRLGFLWAGAGRYPEALAAYQAAATLDADDLTVYLNLARLALGQNDRAAYRANLAEILKRDPAQAERRQELADALLEDGLTAEAQAQYQRLLEDDPGRQAARLKLIGLLEAQGDRDRLAAEYEKLLASAPEDKVAAYNLGVLCFQKKDWPRAIDAFKKVTVLDPRDAQAHAYLLAAYQETGRKTDFLAEALVMFRLKPDQLAYRDLLVEAYDQAGDWTALAGVGRESVRLRPADAEGWRLLARAQARLGEKGPAAQSLLKVAELSAGQLEPWLAAGAAFRDLGEVENAQKAYQKALEIEPANARASEALLELALRNLRKPGENR